jgi:hypothetical protein
MSNRTLILVISLAALLLGGVFYWLRDGSRDEYDWFEDSMEKERGYSEKSVQPYGTHIMHRGTDQLFSGLQTEGYQKGIG